MNAEATRVLIVDDETPARVRLRRLVSDLPGFAVVGEAAHGEEALSRCSELHPDIVLLDIRMPGLSGLEVAGHLARLAQPPAVVFTTAYDEYAVRAFETRAIGYLLKPVRRERLQETLAHAQRIGRARLAALPGTAPRTHLCIQKPRGLLLIPVSDILYFQADQKYVSVCHVHGEELANDTLRTLEQEFGERFLRIHRNALVAADRLTGLSQLPGGGYEVALDGTPRRLPVSRRHLGLIRRHLRQQ